VHGELDVRPARLHADLSHDGDGRVPHALVFDIRQGLGGRDGDGLAGVHAHGVEVLDGADDDHVVGPVAHDLQLILLPAQRRLLQHDFVDHARVQPAFRDDGQLLPVVGDAAARPAEGEGGADDNGEADPGGDGKGLVQGPGKTAFGHAQADPLHGLPELLAVLGLVDDLEGGPDHLHAVPGQHAALRHGHGRVEAGLPPQRRQERVRALPGDDPGDGLRRDGLDVSPVRSLRVRHDRGRIAVDEDHLVALLLQRLAGLGSGIVELAGLADDDRARADDQDFLDVRPLRHLPSDSLSVLLPLPRFRIGKVLPNLTSIPTRSCWGAWS